MAAAVAAALLATATAQMQQRAVLIGFYDALGGGGWTRSDGWLNETLSECAWFGITCNGTAVTDIRLNGNNLVGTIPPVIANLSTLEALRLNDNGGLIGPVPAFLSRLSRLKRLDLEGNSHTGKLPDEIGDMITLEDLRLYGNDLHGPVAPIWRLRNMRDLRIYNNRLTGTISPEIANWTNLDLMSCFNNALSGTIPPEIGSLLTARRLVSFGSNQINGTIPPEIGNLVNLQKLYLFNNKMKGTIPPQLSSMTALQELRIGRNDLHGTIPASVAALPVLSRLEVENNTLSGSIPAELSTLQILELENNSFSGAIPSALFAEFCESTTCSLEQEPPARFVCSGACADGPKLCGWETADCYCPPGTFRDGVVCTECGPGQFADEEDLLECMTCPAGTFSGPGSVGCTGCPPGFECTRNEDGLYVPERTCIAGTYSDGSVNATCQDCDVGHRCPGATDKQRCEAGKFQDESGRDECKLCPPGRFQPDEGTSESLPCPAGFFCLQGAAVAVECSGTAVFCPPGSSTPLVVGVGNYSITENERKDRQQQGGGAGGPSADEGAADDDEEDPADADGQEDVAELQRLTAQAVCPPGYECVGGAKVPCVNGSTYSSEAGSSSCRACTACSPGRFVDRPCNVTADTMCSQCAPGTSQDLVNAASCTPCPAGFFCPAGAQERLECGSAALYCPGNGAAPLAVPEGNYSVPEVGSARERTGMAVCPSGYACIGGSKTACEPSINFQPLAGQASCISCAACTPGTRAVSECTAVADRRCEACPPGRFQSEKNQDSCLPCPQGHFCPAGSQIPTPCALGDTWQDKAEQAACNICSTCSPGNFLVQDCSALSDRSCDVCEAGKYQGQANQRSCSPCPAGFFCPAGAPEKIACVSEAVYCPANASELFIVEPGFYSVTLDEESRRLSHRDTASRGLQEVAESGRRVGREICPAGFECVGGVLNECLNGSTFAPETGATFCRECAECSPGRYTKAACTTTAEVQCAQCPFHEYQPAASADSCLACPDYSRTAQPGSSVLDSCNCVFGRKNRTETGDDFNCICSAGQFRNDVRLQQVVQSTNLTDITPEQSDSICQKCETGMECSAAGVTLETVYLRDGYWRTRPESDVIYVCPVEEACRGGVDAGDASCRDGHQGPYCSVCKEGYFVEGTGLCRDCSDPRAAWTVLILVVITGGVLVSLLIFLFHLDMQQTSIRLQKSVSDLMDKFKIIWSFFQVQEIVTVSFGIALPRVFQKYLHAVDFVELHFFDGIHNDCWLQVNYFGNLLVTTLGPLVLIAFFCYARRKVLQWDADYWKEMGARLLYVSFLVSFLSLPPATDVAVNTFLCEKLDTDAPQGEDEGDSSYLVADYSIRCHTRTHDLFKVYAVIMILVFPVGTPLFYLYVLTRRHPDTGKTVYELLHIGRDWLQAKKLNEHDNRALQRANSLRPILETVTSQRSPEEIVEQVYEGDEVGYKELQLDSADMKAKAADQLNQVIFLVESYGVEYWWFEIFESYRRLALTALPIAFPRGTLAQATMGILLAVGFFVAFIYLRPYVRSDDNVLAIAAQFVLFTVLLYQLAHIANDAILENKEGERIGVVLVIVHSLIIIAGLYSVVSVIVEMQVCCVKKKSGRERRPSIREWMISATFEDDSYQEMDANEIARRNSFVLFLQYASGRSFDATSPRHSAMQPTRTAPVDVESKLPERFGPASPEGTTFGPTSPEQDSATPSQPRDKAIGPASPAEEDKLTSAEATSPSSSEASSGASALAAEAEEEKDTIGEKGKKGKKEKKRQKNRSDALPPVDAANLADAEDSAVDMEEKPDTPKPIVKTQQFVI